MSSSDWIIIPTRKGKITHVPNHQPVYIIIFPLLLVYSLLTTINQPEQGLENFPNKSVRLRGDFANSVAWDDVATSREPLPKLDKDRATPLPRDTQKKLIVTNLVGGFNHLEKYEFVSWDYYSQYMEKTCSKPATRNYGGTLYIYQKKYTWHTSDTYISNVSRHVCIIYIYIYIVQRDAMYCMWCMYARLHACTFSMCTTLKTDNMFPRTSKHDISYTLTCLIHRDVYRMYTPHGTKRSKRFLDNLRQLTGCSIIHRPDMCDGGEVPHV